MRELLLHKILRTIIDDVNFGCINLNTVVGSALSFTVSPVYFCLLNKCEGINWWGHKAGVAKVETFFFS